MRPQAQAAGLRVASYSLLISAALRWLTVLCHPCRSSPFVRKGPAPRAPWGRPHAVLEDAAVLGVDWDQAGTLRAQNKTLWAERGERE